MHHDGMPKNWAFLLLPLLILVTEPRKELFAQGIEDGIPYKVRFIGLDDKEALKTVESSSFLTTLKGKPPPSLNALRFRAESDIPDIIKALHAHGYYDASLQIRLIQGEDTVWVFVLIEPGIQYILKRFYIEVLDKVERVRSIEAGEIGIELNKPVLATEILEGEQRGLLLLSSSGYPLATIEKREMVADYDSKTFEVGLKVQRGARCRFGELSILGNHQVKEKLFKNKILWKEDELYNSSQIDETQKRLLDTGLFSSVVVSRELEPTTTKNDEKIPMRIETIEAKHRSLNVGASYQTFFGPGLTFGWENRNISGLGRKLSLEGDLTAHTHTGTATFFVPDWWTLNQDFICQAQSLQESLYAYHERSYSFTTRLERHTDTRYQMSFGLKAERLFVTNSVQNEIVTLLEIPAYVRWSSANHLLNPTKGATLEYRAIPTVNFTNHLACYLQQSINYAFYFSVIEKELLVIAQQITLTSILSQGLETVPVPKRILGGSDTELRGYRYHTVSDLKGNKPIGGRSAIFYTFEPRFRFKRSFGIVPFFDLGCIYPSLLPNFKSKCFKSLGLGFRYFTFLGPLRIDVAFPLDRRKPIDSVYRILLSIGQTF